MIPASMGLRFQVPPDLESFTVTASWGTYETVETDQVTKAGRPIRHFQRTPVEESRTIRLADLPAGQTVTVPLRESICLRVDRYDDPTFGRVLVEIALCNDRETPTPIPIGDVDVPDQAARRLPAARRSSCRFAMCWSRTGPSTIRRCSRLNLQYRNRLEFAIGRTCSVDWSVKPGSRRATAVWTTWLPVAETPQTSARSVENALLSMDALAQATPEELRAGLEPLVAGYGRWLDGQQAAAAQLPEHLRETAELVLWEARQTHRSGCRPVWITSSPIRKRCGAFGS